MTNHDTLTLDDIEEWLADDLLQRFDTLQDAVIDKMLRGIPLLSTPHSPSDILEWWQERAAIHEYDGHCDRATAERMAAWDTLGHFYTDSFLRFITTQHNPHLKP